jgi:hypothetical protein
VIYGWHFVQADRTLAHSGEPVEVGRTYRVEPPLKLCERGLHGSLRLIDALGYARSSVLTRCSFSGEIIHGDDKLVASERTVLWMGDIAPILHEGACVFAEQALRLIPNPAPRSVAAIAAKRAWLRGEITGEELAAARAAARDAAWDAAGDVSLDAAGDAARDAAWDAARAAAWAATRDAARAAARAAQNDWLECAVREFAGVDSALSGEEGKR